MADKKDRGGTVDRGWTTTPRYNVIVEENDSCCGCVHADVCHQKMDELCENYLFGTSAARMHDCECCTHRYARFARDNPVPCFRCLAREEMEPTGLWRITRSDIGIIVAFCPDEWKDECLAAVPGLVASPCSKFRYDKARTQESSPPIVNSRKALRAFKKHEKEMAQ
jgi:hypothetical protein